MKQRIVRIGILALAMLAIASGVILAGDDIAAHRSCSHCDMDRKAYGYSRMLVRYEEAGEIGVCSLHCAVTELNENKTRKVKDLLVADRNSRTLIDAEKAHWVMGGKKRGVMTQRPKWAFATLDAAQAFVKSQGGTILGWPNVLAAAREDAMPQSRR